MGNAFACSTFCVKVWSENKEEAFRLAQAAASEHERNGSCRLGVCFRNGFGCEKDLNFAIENFLIAAELGHVRAAACYGEFLDESSPACWLWFGRAALRGSPLSFLVSFSKHVDQFFSGSGNSTVVFLIGHALKGNIDVEKKQIFGEDAQMRPATRAVSFYDSQIKAARLAVDTWMIIGIRFGICKDVRKWIGKVVWDSRAEANYSVKVEPKNGRQCFIH